MSDQLVTPHHTPPLAELLPHRIDTQQLLAKTKCSINAYQPGLTLEVASLFLAVKVFTVKVEKQK